MHGEILEKELNNNNKTCLAQPDWRKNKETGTDEIFLDPRYTTAVHISD